MIVFYLDQFILILATLCTCIYYIVIYVALLGLYYKLFDFIGVLSADVKYNKNLHKTNYCHYCV